MTPNLQYFVELHSGTTRYTAVEVASDVGKAMEQAIKKARQNTVVQHGWLIDRVTAGDEVLFDAKAGIGLKPPTEQDIHNTNTLANLARIKADWVVAWEDIAAIREPKHIDKAILNTAHLNGNNIADKDAITRYVLCMAIGQGRMGGAVMSWLLLNGWIGPR